MPPAPRVRRPAPPAPPVPAPAPAPAAPRRFSAALFWAVMGTLITLFVANLAGYGPAIVRHESVRVVLPPSSRQAQPAQSTRRIAAPKPQVKAPAPVPVPPAVAVPTQPAVAVPAPTQRVVVDVNVNVNVRAPQSALQPAPMPTWHEGVVCDRYQGCTHFWVDPPLPAPPATPIPPQAP